MILQSGLDLSAADGSCRPPSLLCTCARSPVVAVVSTDFHTIFFLFLFRFLNLFFWFDARRQRSGPQWSVTCQASDGLVARQLPSAIHTIHKYTLQARRGSVLECQHGLPPAVPVATKKRVSNRAWTLRRPCVSHGDAWRRRKRPLD